MTKLNQENSIMKWICDIEIYKNFFLICFQNVDTQERKSFQISQYKSEKYELLCFLKNDVDCMIGFNNLQFDYPLLHYLILHSQNFEKDSHLVSALWNEAQRLIKNPISYYNIVKNPFIRQIDLFKIHHYDNPAKMNSLKHLEFNLRLRNVQELPYKYDSILSQEQQEKVTDYCWNDMDATYQFYLKSLDEIVLRENLSQEYHSDFTNYSSSKIGETIFIKEFEKTGNVVIPDTLKPIAIKDIIFDYVKFQQPVFNKLLDWFKSKTITETKGVFSKLDLEDMQPLEGYYHQKLIKGKQENLNVLFKGLKIVYGTGGIHASTDAGIYESDDNYIIKSCDVASLYPNLGIQNNVYPPQLSELFCQIYSDLYEKRKTFPKKTPMNLAIKLALNSVYGKSNSQFSKLYSPIYTMTITINGQLLLTMLAEMLSNIPDSKILMINTDGLEIKIPRFYEPMYNKICKEWEAITKLELEFDDYQKMIIANVNNYIAVNMKGQIKRKGAMFIYEVKDGELEYHKNHSSLVIQKALEAYFIHNIPVEDFISNHDDIFDFFKRTKLKSNARLVKREYQKIEIDTGTKRRKFQDIIISEEDLPKITRYYISNSGKTFMKILPPLAKKPEDFRESNIEVDYLCNDCNLLTDDLLKQIKTDINYNYYIDSAKNIIEKIENQEEIFEEPEN